MGDNGGIENKGENKKEEVVKTPEQLAQERLERYQKNSANFVELQEVVCMVIKNPKSQLGVSVMVGNTQRSLLDIGITELTHIVNKVRLDMDIRQEMMKSKVVPATHGMIDGVREMFRRK